jgi:hypothetical protein
MVHTTGWLPSSASEKERVDAELHFRIQQRRLDQCTKQERSAPAYGEQLQAGAEPPREVTSLSEQQYVRLARLR